MNSTEYSSDGPEAEGQPLPALTTDTISYEQDPRAIKPRFLYIVSERRLVNLDKPLISIGSSRDCHVVLQDPSVSRVHCKIKRLENKLVVCDEGSKNGVFLNGVKIKTAELDLGSSLVLGRTTLRITNSAPQRRCGKRTVFGEMITQDPSMIDIFHKIERLARTQLSVFIYGESGTGKELVAQAIHQQSPRSGEPFIPVNCGALPPDILEAELFGYEKGAFTGADRSKPGLFEAAHNGTIFLDEVAELPLAQQPVLLRVLDSGKVRRVGSTRLRSVNVRVISASNKNLSELVKLGRFRQDLFYRLAETRLILPPLRDRVGDVPVLTRFFLDCMPLTTSCEPPPWVGRQLASYRWPGNIRELRNLVRRASVLGWQSAIDGLLSGECIPAPEARKRSACSEIADDPKTIDPGVSHIDGQSVDGQSDHFREDPTTCIRAPRLDLSVARDTKGGYQRSGPNDKGGYQHSEPSEPEAYLGAATVHLPVDKQPNVRFEGKTLEEIEQEMIQTALSQTKGNQAEAARLLGMRRSTFRLRLNKLRLGH